MASRKRLVDDPAADAPGATEALGPNPPELHRGMR